MASAHCTKCGKVDFLPEMACRSCGNAYDPTTQARIRMDELRGPMRSAPIPGRPRRPSKRRTYLASIAPSLTIAALVLTGSVIRSCTESEPSQHAPPTYCAADNATCLGNRELSRATAPCKNAIGKSTGSTARWTYSALDGPFTQVTWYTPLDTIIFTGNQLEAGGLPNRRSYFCVWSPYSHSVVKAGVNE